MDSKINNNKALLQAFDIMVEEKIWHDVKASELLRILTFLNSKAWLHMPEIDNEVVAVIAAYRIKEISDECMTKIPEIEDGNILYVPMAISLKKEENIYKVVRESLNIYLGENPDITQLVLEDKNEKLKVYNIGAKNGQGEIPRATSTTNAVY